MHRNFPLVLTLVAWLLATGSQWDVLQTIAWARMFTENARTLPLDAALARTFSPEGRCELCQVVTAGKQQQENAGRTPAGETGGKTYLVYMPVPDVLLSPPETRPLARSAFWADTVGRSAPPLPPPRTQRA